MREKPVAWCLILILVGNAAVFAGLGWQASTGALPLDRLVTFAVVASAIGRIAFGGFSWALDGAAAPVAAVERLAPAMARGALAPYLKVRIGRSRPAQSLGLRDLSFRYPDTDRLIFDGLNLSIPAGMSIAIVGQNGAGKTTLAKLLCRLYDPTSGAIEVDGIDLRLFDVEAWRSRITVFQDFVRFELTLRQNVDPGGTASDQDVRAALADAGADRLAELDTPLSKGYPGGTDLSGGQWQRVALARAVQSGGAPDWSCSTSRRRSLTCGVRRRSSTGFGGDPAGDHDLDFSSLLNGPARRPDLCARTRSGDRTRQPRRADGRRRSLSEDVRPPGQAVRGDDGRRRSGLRCPLTPSPPRSHQLTGYRRPCPRCGGCASWATPTNPGWCWSWSCSPCSWAFRMRCSRCGSNLLGNAVTAQDSATIWIVLGLMTVSATMTWLLTVVNARLTRRFRDRVTVALETHVATLQASVSGLEHQERSDYLDRLEVLRTQIFVLDHMYASVLNTLGWLVRLTITLALLASIHPGLLLLAVFAVPTVVSSVRRPAAERRVEEQCAPRGRLAEHFFRLATGPEAGKEVGNRHRPTAAARRRQEWRRWFFPIARARWVTAASLSGAWAVFALAYVGAVVFVVAGLRHRWDRCCSFSRRALNSRPTWGRPSGDRLPARHLDGRRPPTGLAGGLRPTRSPPTRCRGPG